MAVLPHSRENCMIKLAYDDGMIKVNVPYSNTFISKLKKNIGTRKWDPENKVWLIPESSRPALMKILKDVYGYEEGSYETCSVEITFPNGGSVVRGPISIYGIILAEACGRDSGAVVGKNVTVLDGGFNSDGSRANWETMVYPGTRIRVDKFPDYAIDCPCNIQDVHIKIIDKSIDKEALLEEKESLLKRIDKFS